MTRTNQTRTATAGGTCPVCKYRVRLRASGTIGAHHLWSGTKYLGVCPGTGRQPAPYASRGAR